MKYSTMKNYLRKHNKLNKVDCLVAAGFPYRAAVEYMFDANTMDEDAFWKKHLPF